MALRDRINRTAPELPDWAKDIIPTDAHAQHSPVDLRDQYELIPRANIERWQNNPRGLVAYDDVPQLRDDILSNRERNGGLNGSGIEVPLIVRPHPTVENKYILMDGERRWMATEGTVVTELPCIIRLVSENEALEAAIRIDLNNEDWSPVQAGKAILRFMDGQNADGQKYSIKQGAKKLGASEGFIKNRIRAAQASPDLQAMAIERPDSMSHIEYLEQVENPRKRRELIKQVLNGASVKTISQQVAEITKKSPPPSHSEPRASLPSLPPRPAFDGYDYSPPLPGHHPDTTRTVVLDAPPAYVVQSEQVVRLLQSIAAQQIEYSLIAEYVAAAKAAIERIEARRREKAA